MQDTYVVSVKVKRVIVCTLLNGYVADDLVTSNLPKPLECGHFAVPFVSLYWVNLETSNLLDSLIILSSSVWTANILERGTVTSCDQF